MAFYLGLDCGGTSTRAMVIDEDGQVVFEGRSGPANWASTDREQLLLHLRLALQGQPKVDRACACFAGLLTEQDAQEASVALSAIAEAPAIARPDFHAALSAAGDSATCCVIAGTGSLVFSQLEGKTVKGGGGGPLLGDQGSAFALGRDALQIALFGSAVVAAVSERFMEKCEELFGTRDASEIPARIYREPSPAARVAKLTPTVAEDFASGEEYARTVITNQMRQLAYIVHGHLSAYHQSRRPWSVRLTGGLWDISDVFLAQFETHFRLMAGGKDAVIARLERPPVFGAALIAKQSS